MKRRLACTSIALSLLVGCGGGGGSTPTNNNQATFTKGLITVDQTAVGVIGLSPRPDKVLRISVPVSVRALNDIPCDLDYARMQIYVGGVEIERSEMSANDIIRQAGSNHVAQGNPLAFTIYFDFSHTGVINNLVMYLRATDTKGNVIDTTLLNMTYRLDPALQ